VAFEVTIEGETFRTDDLSLDEAIMVEKATGTSWLYINPLRSAGDCRAVMVAFLSRSRSKADAEATVARLFGGPKGMKAAIDAVKTVEEDLPDEYEDGLPKAGGGPSTPTS
jgi:hypothetical protein